jgi:hypothetical protein
MLYGINGGVNEQHSTIGYVSPAQFEEQIQLA